ncbi:zinc finger MYM-type protein 1-like [Lycorma delicatula]|uniref:zinc finger MYM-type protein 1-like n=1 Tax=Lycorma delicatula TaxID=130591 RepID=UPI003F50FD69
MDNGRSGNESDCIIDSLCKKSFNSRSFTEKMDIVRKGRPIPDLKNLKHKTSGGYERHFNLQWYDDNPWLCGSLKLSKLFCWPCILFADEKNSWNRDGVCNMDAFRTVRSRHENSKNHIAATCSLIRFSCTKIDRTLNDACKRSIEAHNELIRKNRYVMERLISATCFIALQELPFRRQDESTGSDNKGNCVELLHWIAETDPQLHHYLQTWTGFSGILNDMENDIVHCISSFMLEKIKNEVANVSFVSVIIDENTDVSEKSQLSTVLRYVSLDGDIHERFLGFIDITEDKTTDRLSHVFFQCMDEFECGKKLVSVTYDGSPILSEDNGLHNQIKLRFDCTLFVHYYGYRLNLVLEKSLSNLKDCKIFFLTVNGFSGFFSKSTKRSQVLDREVKRHILDTCGNCNSGMIEIISRCRDDLIKLLQSMMNSVEDWDGETRISARAYYLTLLDPDFVFFIEIFIIIFPKVDLLFGTIKRKLSDVWYCRKNITKFISELVEFRDKFEEIWFKVEKQDEPPVKIVKIDQDEDRKDSRRRLFYEIIDILIVQITNLFSDIEELQFFSLLDGDKFSDYDKNFPEQPFQVLTKRL